MTPVISAARAKQIAATFDLRALPPDFYADPYPVYDVLRAQEPVRRMPDGSYFLTRHADLVAVYRDADNFSSDKKTEFEPKYGRASALFEHHTTSLVFNDPPLHTRVRKLMMGALTRRAIADVEPGLIVLVDELLDAIDANGGGDLVEDFASPVRAPIISLRTRVCSGGSLKTRLVVWCSKRAEPQPYLGSNSIFLSELKLAASRYTATRSACRVRKYEPSGMRRTGSCARSTSYTG